MEDRNSKVLGKSNGTTKNSPGTASPPSRETRRAKQKQRTDEERRPAPGKSGSRSDRVLEAVQTVLIACLIVITVFSAISYFSGEANSEQSAVVSTPVPTAVRYAPTLPEPTPRVVYVEVTPRTTPKPLVIYVTPEPTPQPDFVEATGDVYVRLNPNRYADVIGVLKEGRVVEFLNVIERDERGIAWLKIQYGLNTGWVSSRHAKLLQ